MANARNQIQKMAKQKIGEATAELGRYLAEKARRSQKEVGNIEKASLAEQADAIQSAIREAQAKVRQDSLDGGEEILQQTIAKLEDVDDSWKQAKEEYLADPDKARSASRLQELGEI